MADADTGSRAAIVVVAAVVERDGRFLLTLRPAGTHLAGRWEFPGGKCEPDETQAEALRRELREELDVEAEVGPLVHRTTHVYPERTVDLHFYACALAGTPRPVLGQQMRWASRPELSRLPFPEADAELIRRLVAAAVR